METYQIGQTKKFGFGESGLLQKESGFRSGATFECRLKSKSLIKNQYFINLKKSKLWKTTLQQEN